MLNKISYNKSGSFLIFEHSNRNVIEVYRLGSYNINMLPTPEISRELKPAQIDVDKKVAEKILTPEYLSQPGAKIATKFLDILKIQYGQSSSSRTKSPDNFQNEHIIEGTLTNKAGTVFKEDGFSFISRDQRHLLKDLDQRFVDRLLAAMNPKLATIFENEFEHQEAKKEEGIYTEREPFAYVRLDDIDLVLKGYRHAAFWQEEHGKYLANTAKNAQILSIEGFAFSKFGESLKAHWEGEHGHYDMLMREAVRQGFGGFFAEVDPVYRREISVDGTNSLVFRSFPDLPDVFFQKYFGYLENFFPEDAKQIKNSQNLKEILRLLSTTDEGLDTRDRATTIENIKTHSPAYVDKNLHTSWDMTGLEFGERNFRDAMSAIKLHLIANEMREGRIEKGVIVDFEGANHLQAKFFFLRNPLYAMMTVLKNPHFVLIEQLAKKDDISSLYPTFSPDQKMFKDMFEKIYRLELARPEKEPGRTEIHPGPQQMPMKKYEISGRDKLLNVKMEKLVLTPF